MLIYEVNVAVEPDAADEYRGWIGPHAAHIVSLAGFRGATVFERDPADEGAPGEQRVLFSVHYLVDDRATLERYFNQHAAAMRAEGLARFGGRMSLSRRVLQQAAHYDPPAAR